MAKNGKSSGEKKQIRFVTERNGLTETLTKTPSSKLTVPLTQVLNNRIRILQACHVTKVIFAQN